MGGGGLWGAQLRKMVGKVEEGPLKHHALGAQAGYSGHGAQ